MCKNGQKFNFVWKKAKSEMGFPKKAKLLLEQIMLWVAALLGSSIYRDGMLDSRVGKMK